MDTATDSRIEPYSPDWFKLRQGKFTGSEFFRLMTEPRTKKAKESGEVSEGALTYILEKVWESLSGSTKSGVDNFATEWGNEQEPIAVKWYETLTKAETSDSYLVINDSFPNLIGTPDRLVGEDGMIEIKCPFNGSNHLKHCFITTEEYFRDEHPNYYFQIQCYLLLTSRKWCDFVSFDPRIDSDLGMFIFRVNANDSVQDEIIEKLTIARELFYSYLMLFTKKSD